MSRKWDRERSFLVKTFFFADMGVSIVRSINIDNLDSGLLPQKWMGQKIVPIANEGGLDIDYEWQCGQAEWWVNKLGTV